MESDNRPIPWTSDRARETYNLAGWSAGYFDINAEGYAVALSPLHPDHPGVDLFGLSQELKAAGLSLPVLVRFNYILRDRLDQLCNAFARAMKESDYRGRYTAVYPIKVNQQRGVVEQLLKHGGARGFGGRQRAGADGRDRYERARRGDRLQRLQGSRIHPPGPFRKT